MLADVVQLDDTTVDGEGDNVASTEPSRNAIDNKETTTIVQINCWMRLFQNLIFLLPILY